MTEEKKPRLPEVGEFVPSNGILLRVEELPPPPQPPPTQVWVFLDVDYRTEVRRNGKVLDERSTINDFYAAGQGLRNALKEARDYCAEEAIGPDDSVEVVIVQEVRERWMVPSQQHRDGCVYSGRRFEAFDEYNGPGRPSPFEPRETEVWTSRKPDEVKTT